MIQMTMQVPDELAKRIQPITLWVPTINEANMLSENEQQELDELQRLEHVIIMLKTRITT